MVSLDGYGGIFYRNVQASGVIPQISVILGPCAGGAVYSPAMTDFIFMVREKSHMFITGPDVVKTVTGEEVTLEELGGAGSHSSKSGVATFVANSEEEVLDQVKDLLAYLPANNLETAPMIPTGDDPDRLCPELDSILPDSPNVPYDMKAVIGHVVDDGDFMEYHASWGKSIVCGFARLDGRAVGVVGNQPMMLAGVLDIESSEKAARFVRTCDAFNIPLITFVDVPGFLPGVDQEYGGIIRHGAKLLYAYCEATVPRMQIITRKAYGGAYVVMDSKGVGCDIAGVAIGGDRRDGTQGQSRLSTGELADAADPEARRAELVEDYTQRLANPYLAAERGYVDDVIEPSQTRRKLIAGMRLSSQREDPGAQARERPAVAMALDMIRSRPTRRWPPSWWPTRPWPRPSATEPESPSRWRFAAGPGRAAPDTAAGAESGAPTRQPTRPVARVSESGCGYRPTRYRPTTRRLASWISASHGPTGRSRGIHVALLHVDIGAHRRRPRR